MKDCCIVIPLYKTVASTSEMASLQRAIKILGDYSIQFVCAKTFNPKHYTDLVDKHEAVKYSIETFDEFYFSSINGYNKLLIKKEFYKRFSRFKYLLVYQLDAWVFKNRLEYWCNQDYDYVGAPWLHQTLDGKLAFDGVGNGGLSLRKIDSHIKVLNRFSFIKKPGYFLYLIKKQKSTSSVFHLIKSLTFKNNTYYLFNDYNENEDKFWGIIANRNFSWFKVPPLEIAKFFSVEEFPSKLINNENDMPFGCHAWEKYEPEFWKKHIEI